MLPAAAMLPAKAGCRLHGQTIRDIYNTKLNQNPVIVKLSACTHKTTSTYKQHTKLEKLEFDSHTRSAAQSLTHACAQRERERERERGTGIANTIDVKKARRGSNSVCFLSLTRPPSFTRSVSIWL